jgi:signal transduction histidine kinase
MLVMDSQEHFINAESGGRNRLRNEIVGGALVVTISLLFVFGAFAYWQGFSTLTEESLKSLEAVAAVQQARVEAFAEDGAEDLEMLATRPQLISALADYNTTRERGAVEALGSVVVSSERTAADVVSIEVFDAGLGPVFATTETAEDIPDSYLSRAREGIVSGLVTRTESGRFVHLIAGPIVLAGELQGVAVIGQSTETLFQLTADRSGLGDTGETIIAQTGTESPTYIAPLRFDRGAMLEPIRSDFSDLPMTEAAAGIEMETPRGVDYRGREVFAVTKYVDGPGWGLVVKKDRAEALAPLEEFALFALGVLAVGLVLAYFLTERFTNRTLQPVRKVTETAKAIAGGRHDLIVHSNRRDEIGELARAFGDMTTQLNTLTSELEERVQERTRELREKNAELARVMQDKETFLAGVSHEVRSPLTAMIGFLDLVNDAGDSLGSEERTEMLETVSRQADDVLNLIEDLLASARVEAGTLKVVSVRCDLAAQIRQVVESIQHSTRIDIELIGDGAIADADPSRVRQIIRNLLTNADRYGGNLVVVETDRLDGVAAIQVRDDGRGVPEQDRREIFEPYGQSEANRRVDGSVGLGLHVSRELARLMGGDLAYDYVDGWSVFSLFLPEHYDEPQADSKPEAIGLRSG